MNFTEYVVFFFVYKVRQYSDIGGVSVLLLHANFRQLARLW